MLVKTIVPKLINADNFFEVGLRVYAKNTDEKSVDGVMISRLIKNGEDGKVVKKPLKILDIGCGDGSLARVWTLKLLKKNIQFNLYGLDESLAMTQDYFRNVHNAMSKKVHRSTVQVLQGNFDKFDVSNKTYDVIICAHVYLDRMYLKTYMTRMLRMLKPTGILVFIERSKSEPVSSFVSFIHKKVGKPMNMYTSRSYEDLLIVMKKIVKLREFESCVFKMEESYNKQIEWPHSVHDRVAITSFLGSVKPEQLSDESLRDISSYIEKNSRMLTGINKVMCIEKK